MVLFTFEIVTSVGLFHMHGNYPDTFSGVKMHLKATVKVACRPNIILIYILEKVKATQRNSF